MSILNDFDKEFQVGVCNGGQFGLNGNYMGAAKDGKPAWYSADEVKVFLQAEARKLVEELEDNAKEWRRLDEADQARGIEDCISLLKTAFEINAE